MRSWKLVLFAGWLLVTQIGVVSVCTIPTAMRLGSPGQVCGGDCFPIALEAAEVDRIVAQGVIEAQRLGVAATLAVLDRVGNVLALYAMPGASATTLISSRKPGAAGMGLDGAPVPAPLAALSKAGTAAYLSSQGNAFTTRSASQIVQEHFNPGERFRPSGPLFGVQFSQLPCGDLVRRDLANGLGPKRMPLGLSADPGGIPLYIWGVPVGGVGVELDGEYGADPRITDFDTNLEERIAGAAAQGFAAPLDRRANRIAVDGRYLRFADDQAFAPAPDPVPALASLPGALLAPNAFWDGVLKDGALHQAVESGIAAAIFEGVRGEILVEGDGSERYPPTASATPGGLTEPEVRTALLEALRVAERTRGQIRRPAGSKARVSISVVDTTGAILGVVRGVDAPIFGIDVSLQKARTAALFSGATAAADLTTAGFGSYVDAARTFLGDPTALTGRFAFSDRAGGNLSRPFFPDGIDGRAHGPFSKPFAQWSPFNDGLQLDLVLGAVVAALGVGNPASCTHAALDEIKNGIQIFPGSVPIYRGDQLIGGIGVSGDGVDQDDLIAFLGLHNAGGVLGGAIGNAPIGIRADRIAVQGVRLRYVNCPPAPFLDGSSQSVCENK